MKLNHTLLFICFALFYSNIGIAQKRYKDEIFNKIDSFSNIQYGQNINIKNEEEKLLLDVFIPPSDDSLKRRPLIIFIHGGGFSSNNKTGQYSSMLCTSFAKRGYVAASIDYRLGVEKTGFDSGKKVKSNKDYAEAMYRAQQDGKAAVRFFRRYADQYGIDTNQIFITGSSAGSKTCLAMAYMNEDEIPAGVDQNKWGSLEGNSGNEGYSSKVQGVINAWGAMIDYNWIQKEEPPLFNTAGTMDKTVPFDSSYDWHSFKYGPYILFQQCLKLGISTGWRPFYNTGHTLDNNKIKQDSCVQSIAAWLYTQLKMKKGKKEDGVHRWEKDIQKFDSLNASENHGKKAIMFIGSSYIRMWKNIRDDLKYDDIIHRGFGGSNLSDVAYYINRIVSPHQPKAIFIYVGNDITAGEKDKAPDQVLELFKYVVKCIREKLPETPITWLAISPSEKRWAAWDKVQTANHLIEEYCKNDYKLFYLDAGNKFLNDESKPNSSLYLDDKLHYNETGYSLWGNSIRKMVKKISKK